MKRWAENYHFTIAPIYRGRLRLANINVSLAKTTPNLIRNFAVRKFRSIQADRKIYCFLSIRFDPDPKSCSIQKQNSGMMMTPLSGGCADEKVMIHRRADYFCPEAG